MIKRFSLANRAGSLRAMEQSTILMKHERSTMDINAGTTHDDEITLDDEISLDDESTT